MKHDMSAFMLIGAVIGALLLPFAHFIMWLTPDESVIQSVLYPVWFVVMFPAVTSLPPHGLFMDAAIEVFWIILGTLVGLAIAIMRRGGQAHPKI